MAGASRTTIDAIAHDHSLAGLRGIGLSGQMHGAVCLDARRPGAAAGDPLERRARPWPNAPSSRRPSRARARSPATSLCRASPRRRSPGCAGTSPRSSRSIDTVLLPKDYIRFRLTGHHVSEMSDAAGTLWLDVAARDWSDDLLEATGLTRAHMPRLVEGSAALGRPPARRSPAAGAPRRRSSSPAAPATTPRRPAASAW